jgi:hypothetical protein
MSDQSEKPGKIADKTADKKVEKKTGKRNARLAKRELDRLQLASRPYLPKRQHKSIKLDRVQAADLRRYDVRFFCDQCSHYSPSGQVCTMGYQPQHTSELQLKLYDLTGMMAFCRFMEID